MTEVAVKTIKTNPKVEEKYKPKTPLGKSLWEIRKQIIASGVPLLTSEEIEREVRERRGERMDYTE
ncbi:MAG: hypothetical protein P9X24_05880 [Candidatus Hatepunaea meridiana]|nr:hypothetical protein [Candidatus Hatepunaea meridiana]